MVQFFDSQCTYTVSQKVPTFIPSVNLSNINRFSNFFPLLQNVHWFTYAAFHNALYQYPLRDTDELDVVLLQIY